MAIHIIVWGTFTIKTFVIFLAALLLQAALIQGQPSSKLDDFKQHVKFRCGLSNTTNTQSFESFGGTALGSRITMIYLGIECGISLRKNWHLYGGLQQVNKGFKTHEVHDYGTYFSDLSYRYNLAYIEMPLYIQKSTRRISWNAGIVGCYLLRSNWLSEWYIDTGGKGTYYIQGGSIIQYFRRWDFGVRCGVTKRISDRFELELVLQKNFITPYKPHMDELARQQTVFFGFKYQIF